MGARVLKTENEESTSVSSWMTERVKDGVLPHEFGVFVRSAAQPDRARAAVRETGMTFKVLDERVETSSGHVSISTMHLAKDLEFRAVVVMACDDEVIPLQERIETVGDDADLQEVYGHGAPPALRRLHAGARPSARHERRASIRVP